MEKLLNLLNEYECYRNGYDICTGWQERDGRIVWVTDDPRPQVRSEYYILSKEFGFIKWLVENEKIDLGSRNPLIIYEYINEGEKQRPYSFYEEMLIRLALSDTPIEDLISYLK